MLEIKIFPITLTYTLSSLIGLAIKKARPTYLHFKLSVKLSALRVYLHLYLAFVRGVLEALSMSHTFIKAEIFVILQLSLLFPLSRLTF